MSLETEHRRHHTEPTPHPDEPQPVRWGKHQSRRHGADWTSARFLEDLQNVGRGGEGRRRAA